MSLHPCQCGESAMTDVGQGLFQTEQGVGDEHHGVCAGCGRNRRFVFRVPSMLPRAPDRYGGSDPSQIIDAGEWRAISLAYMGKLDHVRDDVDQMREVLQGALAAYQEMLKFIPPGEQQMPDSAFFTERGRRVRADERPGSFTRLFLEAMVDGVRADLARCGD